MSRFLEWLGAGVGIVAVALCVLLIALLAYQKIAAFFRRRRR